MGPKISTLKVAAKVTVCGGTGVVDAIRLSYQRRTCCGRRWRQFASFTFPGSGWSREDVVRNSSSNVAAVPIGKLRKKEGDTPVKVACMVAGVPVLETKIAMADLRQGLERTKGVLLFSLVGRVAGNSEPKEHAFVALFCNGKRCGGDNGEASSGLKQDKKPVETPGQLIVENTVLQDQSGTREGERFNTEPPSVSDIDQVETDHKEIQQLTMEVEEMEIEIRKLQLEEKVVRRRKARRNKKNTSEAGKSPECEQGSSRNHSHRSDFAGQKPGWVWGVLADCCAAAGVMISLYNVWQCYRDY